MTKPFTLVVGLGATGLSCARFLASQGVPFAVTDSRLEPPALAQLHQELPEIPVFLGKFDAALFNRAAQLVVSPGVALSHPIIAAVIERGIPVIGDIEIFARHVQAPVVAITGSNGKSTVTTLVGEMARRAGRNVAVGGNLGTAALDLLSNELTDLYVLELSSFQLDTTYSLNAAAAVVLNLSPDHLDRHGSMANYIAAKERIYHGNGVMVINADDPLVVNMALPQRVIRRFSLGLPYTTQDYGIRSASGCEWLSRGVELLMPINEIKIIGRHNLANTLAALALSEAIGLPLNSCLATLREFSGLPHRCQFVAELNGVSWYNDSKGTNVGATEAACAGLTGGLILIAGGQGKGQDFTPLRAALAGKARAVILIGVDAQHIKSALAEAMPVIEAPNLRAAVEWAQQLAHSGDRVLLSPACASFDMFQNYIDRGERFIDEVNRLAAMSN